MPTRPLFQAYAGGKGLVYFPGGSIRVGGNYYENNDETWESSWGTGSGNGFLALLMIEIADVKHLSRRGDLMPEPQAA